MVFRTVAWARSTLLQVGWVDDGCRSGQCQSGQVGKSLETHFIYGSLVGARGLVLVRLSRWRLKGKVIVLKDWNEPRL